MTRNGRLWIGATLLAIILFNYAMIGIPIIKRSRYIEDKTRTTLISQVKAGKVLKNSEDDFMLEILKREKVSLDRRLLVLNCVAITLGFIAISWTAFGIMSHKKR